MSSEQAPTSNARGWIVTLAGLGINLVLGTLYAWGVMGKALVVQWKWSKADAGLPFAISTAAFAVMMIFAGRAQDKLGPRRVAMVGGVLFGLGLATSSLATTPLQMALTFGLLGGIGGSGDFTRNAFLSIFTCPSTAKGGKISTIVPLVSHMDHSEHSVGAVITEQGVADLRGTSPNERARKIIENCAHPSFREPLLRYCAATKKGHTPQSLGRAFAFHQRFMETGDMHGAVVD